MSEKITWVRPSGTEITTNGDRATVQYAAELGWKPKGEEAPPAKATASKAEKTKASKAD